MQNVKAEIVVLTMHLTPAQETSFQSRLESQFPVQNATLLAMKDIAAIDSFFQEVIQPADENPGEQVDQLRALRGLDLYRFALFKFVLRITKEVVHICDWDFHRSSFKQSVY